MCLCGAFCVIKLPGTQVILVMEHGMIWIRLSECGVYIAAFQPWRIWLGICNNCHYVK